MTNEVPIDKNLLRERLIQLRKDPEQVPDASVVVPVNAEEDLENILQVISDVVKYWTFDKIGGTASKWEHERTRTCDRN